ncbi:MAG: MFS transporter [Clostridiales bacterium]|nr:MFS transporter [Eubacteriales bacterium]MDH7566490.1 MFS transporter [Clostridiales bacterium]
MSTTTNIKAKLHTTFRALSHKDFRYFWLGQCVSLIGTWMQNIGQSWLVFSITKSPLLLGLVGTLQFTPVLLFSLFAGVFVDRFPKRKLLLFTQSTAMTLAFILSALILTGRVRYWHVLIIATILGTVNTLDMPARQTFMIELVGREDLMNAIALNSSIFNAARIIGPALAGLIMSLVGTGFCFLINGISFIPVLYGLTRITPRPAARSGKSESNVLKEIKEGLVYVFSSRILYGTILAVLVMGIFAMNFNVLVPVLAKNVLGQNEAGFGLLMSAMGAGSLVGAVIIAAGSKSGPRGTLLFLCSAATSVILVLLGLVRIYFVSALLLGLVGISNTAFFTTANSTLQLNSGDEFRGRVVSLYTLVFGGSTPFGNLFAGGVSDRFGVLNCFIASGAIIFLSVLGLQFIEGREKTDPDPAEG